METVICFSHVFLCAKNVFAIDQPLINKYICIHGFDKYMCNSKRSYLIYKKLVILMLHLPHCYLRSYSISKTHCDDFKLVITTIMAYHIGKTKKNNVN